MRLAHTHLRAVARVVHPRPRHRHALARFEMRHGPDEHDVPPIGLAVEHREAALLVREALAAHEHLPGERRALGR